MKPARSKQPCPSSIALHVCSTTSKGARAGSMLDGHCHRLSELRNCLAAWLQEQHSIRGQIWRT